MAFQGKPEEAVPIMLNWITKTREGVVERINESNIKNAMIGQFQKVEHQLQDMKDLLPNLKSWEEIFISEFTALQRDMNDRVFDEASSPADKINDKLKSMEEKLKRLKKLFSRTKFPAVDKRHIMSQQQGRAQMVWEDTSPSGVEENVVGSPATDNLEASYNKLPDHPFWNWKYCLLCFSIFPDNSAIKRMQLIFWWIGERFICDNGDMTAQEVGEEILQHLEKEGLIQAVYRRKNPVVNSYKLHPRIRQHLISEAKREKFIDFDAKGTPTNDTSKSSRACIISGQKGPKKMFVETLFNLNEGYLNLEAKWFSKLKKLAVLQLGRWQTSVVHHIEVVNAEFLNRLGAHRSLKYVSLRGISMITQLPSSIVKLINLEILDLKACHNLEKFPSTIASLSKLTHLDMSECYLLHDRPMGLSSLSSLQVLKGIRPGSQMISLYGGLSHLKQLRKLRMSFQVSAAALEGLLYCFYKLSDTLRILAITFIMPSSKIKDRVQSSTTANPTKELASFESERKEAADLIRKMAFPSMLVKLELCCLPCWPLGLVPYGPHGLRNLERLYIRGGEVDSFGSNWEGNEGFVEILRLRYLKNLKVEKESLVEKCPRLKYLEIFQCNGDDLELTKEDIKAIMQKQSCSTSGTSIEKEEIREEDGQPPC